MTHGQLIGTIGLALLVGAGVFGVLGIISAHRHPNPSSRLGTPATRNYIFSGFTLLLAAALLVAADITGFEGL